MMEPWVGIVGAAAPAAEPEPFNMETFQRAVDTILAAPYKATPGYVISDSRWHLLMTKATPEEAKTLQAWRDSGRLIISAQLPDPQVMYRIAPEVLDQVLQPLPLPVPPWHVGD